MSAYIFARIDVTDLDEYMKYARHTAEIGAKFGGKFLVKGGDFEQLEGEGRSRHVLIEFPDMDSARAFYNCDEYQAILPIALENSERELVIVQGAE
jgi:uncharacterized protein (DUF1330 family)